MSGNEIPELDRLRLPVHAAATVARRKLPRHRPGARFLKGPIPLPWLEKAATQPGRALHVALGLWFFAGMKNSPEVAFSMLWLERTFGVARFSGYRGLAALESAGLVSVVRRRGRKSLVTLLDVPSMGETELRAAVVAREIT